MNQTHASAPPADVPEMTANQKAPGGAATRFGRAVQETADQAVPPGSKHAEHHRTNSLRDVILGGQDGLVNILGIILGIIAAGGSTEVLVAAGFAAAITESISMGAVGYTSSIAQRDYVRAEQEREKLEIATEPEAERQEIRDIYAAKGFEGELLNRAVEAITANRDIWLATKIDEELHLSPVDASDIFRSAVIITIATLIGHMIPCEAGSDRIQQACREPGLASLQRSGPQILEQIFQIW